MESTLAPIVLFVYNRPYHTLKTLETLKSADLSSESKLIIFSDGPKNVKDCFRIFKVRKIINKIDWVKKVEIFKSNKNKGLEKSIQSGVNYVLEKYGKAIILEDDILVGKHFLTYMNTALNKYSDADEVYHVAANSADISNITQAQTYFLHNATCWGWGTWRWTWKKDLITIEASELIEKLNKKKLVDKFDYCGASHFLNILKNNAKKNNSSWAIKWYAILVLNNKLSLHPYKTLTQNIGKDGSGTNMKRGHKQKSKKLNTKITIEDIPVRIESKIYDFYKERFSKKFNNVNE